jgi:hypothetical protein
MNSSTRITAAAAMILVEEDRVAPDRVAPVDRLHADRIDMDLAPPADQGNDPGYPAGAAGLGAVVTLDIAGHDVVDAAEPRFG